MSWLSGASDICKLPSGSAADFSSGGTVEGWCRWQKHGNIRTVYYFLMSREDQIKTGKFPAASILWGYWISLEISTCRTWSSGPSDREFSIIFTPFLWTVLHSWGSLCFLSLSLYSGPPLYSFLLACCSLPPQRPSSTTPNRVPLCLILSEDREARVE